MSLVFDISTLGTPSNYITFNDFHASPLFRMKSWFATRRQLEQFDVMLPESSGVDDFQTFIGREFLIIQGKMFPANEYEYNTGREKLRKVSSLAIEQADTNSDGGYVWFKWTENIPKQLSAKVLYVDLPIQSGIGFNQPFTILCKIKYPVVYAQQTTSGTINLSQTSAGQGGAVIPSTIPMRIGGITRSGSALPFVLPVVLGASGGATNTITLTNTGDSETFPTIIINGPITRPKIVNSQTGEYMEFDLNLASTSDNIIISYDQDSLSMTNNGVNCYGKLTSGSTPFRIKSGPASFTLSGSSVGTNASASISFLSAWPLS